MLTEYGFSVKSLVARSLERDQVRLASRLLAPLCLRRSAHILVVARLPLGYTKNITDASMAAQGLRRHALLALQYVIRRSLSA
jgi:hypothetical protein